MKDLDAVFTQIDHFNENLIANIQGGVIICQFDPVVKNSRALYLSEGWTALTGYTLQDLNELFDGNPQVIIYEKDAYAAWQTYTQQTAMGNNYQLEYRFRHKDGRLIWAMDKGVITFSANGYNQNQSILTDITYIKESEERIRISGTRFRIATQASRAAVFEFDIEKNCYLFIENAEVIFAADALSTMAKAQAEIAQIREEKQKFIHVLQAWYHTDDIPVLLQAYEEMLKNNKGECAVRVRQPNNSYIWCRLHQVIIDSDTGQPLRVIGHLTNIDDEYKQTERLRQEAQQDALSKLLNKNAIREHIEHSLLRTPCHTFTLFILDVDNFKGVNDNLGHLFGDAVLMDVAAKLKRLFIKNGIVARIGGDEFVVFLQEELSMSQAANWAEEICTVVRHTYAGEKADHKISCSVGVAFSIPQDTYETLFGKADNALYEAKARGKDQYAVYTQEMLPNDCSMQGNQQREDGTDSGKLRIKERIFELLYDSVNFGSSVNMILALLGQLLDVDRVYILEATPDQCHASYMYEWCAMGVLPVKNEQQVPLERVKYLSQFDSTGLFRCNDMTALPAALQEEYARRNSGATFQVAITEDGSIQGIMGYDRLHGAISHSSELVDLMIFAAKVTGVFIIKTREEEKTKMYNQNKMEALDQLPCAICVIDEAYALQYVNNMILDTIPDIQLKSKCYEAYMKRDTPCPDCPAAACQDAPVSKKMYNPITGIHMISNASRIHWSGKPNMRLVCCQVIQQDAAEE